MASCEGVVEFHQMALPSLLHRHRLHHPAEQPPAFDDTLVIQLPVEIRRVVQRRFQVRVC